MFIHFWQFETLCEKLQTKAKLIVESDAKGIDRLLLKIATARDREAVAVAFKKAIGLSLSLVTVDDTIEKNEILDKRPHLAER